MKYDAALLSPSSSSSSSFDPTSGFQIVAERRGNRGSIVVNVSFLLIPLKRSFSAPAAGGGNITDLLGELMARRSLWR